MNKFQNIKRDGLVSISSGIILGAILSAISAGSFWSGWLGLGILSMLLIFGLIKAWSFLEGGRALAVLLIVAFLARLALGVFLFLGLPVLGFNNPVQNAGYVYSDASERDEAAFQIATSSGSWLEASKQFRSSDQYGGLLLFSAAIYRIFSPDVQRPLTIVLFSAFAMTLGLVFLFDSVKKRWGVKIALAAGWVYALYPDGWLLGSSQMREPFLIGLACIALWACLSWRSNPFRAGIVSLLSILMACLISIPAGLAILAVLLGVVFLDWIIEQQNKKVRIFGWIGFILFIGIMTVAGWMWLKQTLYYESYVTEASSGVIAELLKQIGAQYRIPFVTIYGLTQPLLPAALVDPSKPIWMGIAIFRALGWYLLIPFILYGLFALLKSYRVENNHLLIWFSLAFLAWVVVSSARGGGDQWDNPRYRTIFLPWMAIVVGWVWQQIRFKNRPWFWRWVTVESIFVLFFLNFYINRQVKIGTQIPFYLMIALIVGLSALIFIGGFIYDKTRSMKKISDRNP